MKAKIVVKMEVPDKFVTAGNGIMMEQFKEDLEVSLCASYHLPPEKAFVTQITQLKDSVVPKTTKEES